MRAKAALLAGICFSAFPVAAFAQDTADQDDDADVIIVTATLRQADVQDIPLAVTAVAPETLERQGVVDIKTLSSISPSFNIQSSQTETQGTSIKIRGVGTTGNNTGLESSVGVFIDGVYQSRPGVALGDLLDLERLEILRGPQGTLFGRNTSAGALNITTRRPNLNRIEGFANATYGNFDFFNVQGGVSLPLAEGVAGVRLSGAYRKRDGLLTSSTGAESLNRDRYILRGQLVYEPTADLSVRIIGDYSKASENCCDAVIVRETELAPFFALHGLPRDGVEDFGPGAVQRRNSNGSSFNNSQRQWGISGEVTYDIASSTKLTYIGGYRNFRARSDQDSEFVNLNVYFSGNGADTGALTGTPNFPSNGGPIKTMTHELRLQGSAFSDKLDWLIGAYYSDEKIRETQAMTLGSAYQAYVSAFNFGGALGANPLLQVTRLGTGGTLAGIPGAAGIPITGGTAVNAAGDYAINQFGADSESFSVFTHNVFDLTDNISVTLGARYVDETKDGFFDQIAARSNACQAVVNAIASGRSAAFGATQANFLAATCFPFATSTALTLPGSTTLASSVATPPLSFLPREYNTRFKDNELTYTAQVAYNTNQGTLLYAGLSHGFKSGGFNLDPAAATTFAGGDPRFKSEKVDAYEAGIKTEFANGRIKANLAVFHMDLTDFQVLEFTGIQFITFNVDKAKSTGAELELFGRLDPYINLNLALTYADSRYPSDCADSITNPAVRPSAVRLCGASLTNAPKFSGVFGVTYDGPINDSGLGLLAAFNANYSSSRRTSTIPLDTNGLPIPFDIQEAAIKMNARLGLSLPNERFAIEAWVNNISNEVTRGITANTPLRGPAGARSRIGFIEEPRTYGLTVRTKF
ncbi:Colicin I receptor precursor [Tsuneonella dongtanensis]|uniref:Colicin I receptor n=1 Tax=Tsuneonella dongtanensis TaxID=692370 RepID=A0A1B2ABV0_9SPHN|nr:TonB-dependent receptor [Tsuneonella dongtanensis]ANY19525.1 Colicin I receptor precursor [Tsuneonella dongtanensis]